MTTPVVVFGTPRKLPKATTLTGNVVVLDIAFAASGTGADFERVTLQFINTLGERLRAWIDHHEHEFHSKFAGDSRFVLSNKHTHGACPEMVIPAVVQQVGPVDTIVCHNDLDGMYSAVKWLLAGEEPYPGADADARAIDTRIGQASPLAQAIDYALRAVPKDDQLRLEIIRLLQEKVPSTDTRWSSVMSTAKTFEVQRTNTVALSAKYKPYGNAAVIVDLNEEKTVPKPYDKTELLLLGQQKATLSVVIDEQTITLAAAFDSGINLLQRLNIAGGMPTRVSVPRYRLRDVLSMLDQFKTD